LLSCGRGIEAVKRIIQVRSATSLLVWQEGSCICPAYVQHKYILILFSAVLSCFRVEWYFITMPYYPQTQAEEGRNSS
jgi:hypothetical protein